jgi:hypothetical protein
LWSRRQGAVGVGQAQHVPARRGSRDSGSADLGPARFARAGSASRHVSGGDQARHRKLESVFDNERVTIVFEKNGIEVAVVLIASRPVRRIVDFVHEGETVALGQRIAAIRFGSQVDVVVPRVSGLRVLAQPGQRVLAGESLLAVGGIDQQIEPREGIEQALGRDPGLGSGEASAASGR